MIDMWLGGIKNPSCHLKWERYKRLKEKRKKRECGKGERTGTVEGNILADLLYHRQGHCWELRERESWDLLKKKKKKEETTRVEGEQKQQLEKSLGYFYSLILFFYSFYILIPRSDMNSVTNFMFISFNCKLIMS